MSVPESDERSSMGQGADDDACPGSDGWMRTLVECMPQMAWATDPAGVVEFCNARWYEYTGTDFAMMRAGWRKLVHHPDHIDAIGDAFQHSLRTGAPFEMEIPLRHKDGGYRWFLTRATPVVDERGRIVRWLGTNTDIEEQRRAHAALMAAQAERDTLIAALAESNEELDRFAYVASHDLKAPLRGIKSLAEWLTEDLASDASPSTRENLVLLRERVMRLSKLVDGLLTFARAGKKEPIEPVNVDVLVDDVLDLLSPPPGLRVVRPAPLPTIESERSPFQQIWLNILGNAIRFAASEVRIECRLVAGACEFSVSDDGPGIPEAQREQIFDLFFTSRSHEEGTGLGLSIVKRSVERRGGRVDVEASASGGTRFVFTWPRMGDPIF